MSHMKNPFKHDHHHHHDDVHLPITDGLDPASRSLDDALRVSFRVLQIVMVVLLLLYVVSGLFSVPSQKVAVRLRFGNIVGQSPQQQIIPPGGPHFAFPFPIEQVVYVPTSVQRLTLQDPFWFQTTAADVGKTVDEMAAGKQGPLNPEKDGSLVTGDANIVHARWTLDYRIADPIDFIQNITQPSIHDHVVLSAAERMVRLAAEQGLVHTVASLTADQLMKGQLDRQIAIRSINHALQEMKTGIQVEQLSVSQTAMPLMVRDAFQAVIFAENEKAKLIDEAEKERASILGQTAGEAYESLWVVIQDYEQAVTEKNENRIRAIDQKMDLCFKNLEIPHLHDPSQIVSIGGEVSNMINQSITFRTQIVADVQSEARIFSSQLEQYHQYPQIVFAQKWFETLQTVLTGDVETIYAPPGQLYLETNRDPLIQQKIEEDQLKEEQGKH